MGLPQKTAKGSLEPHLLYIHTSCLSLSKSLKTLGFLQKSIAVSGEAEGIK